MKLQFKPVTSGNRAEALKLKVLPEQKNYIETVEECLAEADESSNWRPVGIYDGELLVGFAMYGRFTGERFPNGRLWLDRLLIDWRYQGKGYGLAALQGLLRRLAEEYSDKYVHLSVYSDNLHAISLYQSLGFHFTGEKDLKGEDVMVRELTA